jgi:hypothetical protein
VIVHRGPAAERVTATYHADAVARGEEIALGLAGSDREPETLALLAHELTHVARHRAPRFVPPVARGAPAPPAGGSDEEESIALRVESRVRSLAAREAESPASARPLASAAADAAPAAGATLPNVPATEEPSGGLGPSAPSSGTADRSQWGELPAPWEPLPQFIWSAPALVADGDAGGPGPSQSEGSGGGAAVVVQRAAVDRGEAREPAPAPPSPAATPGQAAPDIDALARQVYGVLRRRLAAERRRDG